MTDRGGYAVKIGEVHVRAGKPITQEHRELAKKQLRQLYQGVLLILDDGSEVVIRPQP